MVACIINSGCRWASIAHCLIHYPCNWVGYGQNVFAQKVWGGCGELPARAQVTVRPTSASSSTLVLSRLISFPVYIQEIWNQSGATRAIDWLYSCKYLCLWCIASTKPGIVIGFFFLGWFDDFDSGEPSACVWEIIFLFAQYCPDVQWVWVKWANTGTFFFFGYGEGNTRVSPYPLQRHPDYQPYYSTWY